MITRYRTIKEQAKVRIRRAGDGFAVQIPQYDNRTGVELRPDEIGVDLDVLALERDRLLGIAADIKELIDDILEIEQSDPTKESRDWLDIRPKGDGGDG